MSKQISKIYHAAIYVRLSKEDGDVSTSAKAESNSISNQKDFIRNFLADKKDIRIVKEYVDDGYSGSNFDRPSFQTMMEDIKRGVIDCVVVKDLSRFGREYIDSGRYIERLFPALGVRFIAINDNYDSVTGKSQGDEIIIPFKNLINDAYCRDISIKIRSHLDVKRKNGEYIGAFVPYGYEKSDDDKHKLVIDIYAAGIVKEIFRLKLHGMSQDAIATQLNNEGVLAPMEYKQSTGSGYQTGFLQNEKSVWSSVTVRRILENEIYIGNLVQGKRTTPNHKVKQEVVKPESDWIRIEKNHEPIISDRDFEIVQRLLGMDTRISPDSDMVYNLSGIAVCADCGSPMTRKITTAGDKKYAYYICSNHKLTKQCSQHSISVSLLEDTVLEMLKLHIKNVMNLEEILDYIGTIPFQQLDVKSLEARKQKKLEEVEKCKRLKGYTPIAKYLNEQGIMSPLMYLKSLGYQQNVRTNGVWTKTTVKSILTNQAYIGSAVHGKVVIEKYNNIPLHATDPSEWVVVENTHEPLIDKKTFEKAQERVKEISDAYFAKEFTKHPPNEMNLLKGKIVCGDCGKGMRLSPRTTKSYVYFCGTFSDGINPACSRHKIDQEEVNKAVFAQISNHMRCCIDALKVIRELNARSSGLKKYDVYEKAITRQRRELEKVNRKFSELYGDYSEHLINESEYLTLKQQYLLKSEALKKEIDNLLVSQNLYSKNYKIDEDWENLINKYLKCRKLNKELADAFVDKVQVFEDGRISVNLVYDDCLEELLQVKNKREGDLYE